RFEVLRIDGEDYRRRDGATEITTLPEDEVVRSGDEMHEATLDRFDPLLQHLTSVHPSRYGAMIDDVSAAHVTGMHGLAIITTRCASWCWWTGSTTARCRCWPPWTAAPHPVSSPISSPTSCCAAGTARSTCAPCPVSPP